MPQDNVPAETHDNKKLLKKLCTVTVLSQNNGALKLQQNIIRIVYLPLNHYFMSFFSQSALKRKTKQFARYGHNNTITFNSFMSGCETVWQRVLEAIAKDKNGEMT